MANLDWLVVRDLFEKAMTFTEYVSHYKLTRSEGLLPEKVRTIA